ncbi:MAG: iron-containing redox enzyme family protein [Rhodocyclaceae bacterium]|nr:iron-containing redox enzyme family protein [Rhodocyclaceae bacterium]
MTPYQTLVAATAQDREDLTRIPLIVDALQGQIDRERYLRFLGQAYHHVRQTVPLLTACRDRLPPHLAWMKPAFAEYIEEEQGHETWILDDIRAAGGDAEAVRQSLPDHAAEVMVAYAWDQIQRGNPVGFLGMVYVLEGTSVALALRAADQIQRVTGLPDAAFTYLRSHGTLDVEHTDHFSTLVDGLDGEPDVAALVHAAKRFFRLYGDVFRDIRRAATEAA